MCAGNQVGHLKKHLPVFRGVCFQGRQVTSGDTKSLSLLIGTMLQNASSSGMQITQKRPMRISIWTSGTSAFPLADYSNHLECYLNTVSWNSNSYLSVFLCFTSLLSVSPPCLLPLHSCPLTSEPFLSNYCLCVYFFGGGM